jgi:hypothetical protein
MPSWFAKLLELLLAPTSPKTSKQGGLVLARWHYPTTPKKYRTHEVLIGASSHGAHRKSLCPEGKRGGYASAKQNFPRKIGTAAVRDHGITTRRADAAEPSRCRRTRRG